MVISIIFLLQLPCFAAERIEIKYNTQEYKIEADGECSAGIVNISVLPKAYIDNADSLTTELSGTNVIMTSVLSNQGVLDAEIILGDAFPVGCYLISVEGKDDSYSRFFVKADKTTVETVGSQFSTTDNAQLLISNNISNLGFDTALFNQYGEDITEQLKANCNFETVNASNFTDLYLVSEGTVALKKDLITAEELICYYSGILDADIALSYNSLPEDVKTNFGNVLKQQDFSDKSFAKVYADAEILSKVNVLKENAKDELIAYLTSEGVELTDYNNLLPYYKGLLFGELTQTEYTDIDILKKAFNDGIAKQKKAYESNKDDSSGGSGGGGGGGGSFGVSEDTEEKDDSPSDTDNKPQDSKSAFYDINDHWAKASIEEMVARGIINGYEDGSFKPNNSVTRAEFVKILSGLLSLPASTGEGFNDVTMDQWYAPFVYAAVSEGIVNGVTENSFAPNSSISRQDAAVILHRVLSKKGVEFSEAEAFSDEGSIAGYAKDAVMELAGGEILQGSDGKFRPTDTLSRAEAVTMLKRILIYVK